MQNGGLKPKAARTIKEFREDNPEVDEKTFRTVIADAVADNSNPKFRADVRAQS